MQSTSDKLPHPFVICKIAGAWKKGNDRDKLVLKIAASDLQLDFFD